MRPDLSLKLASLAVIAALASMPAFAQNAPAGAAAADAKIATVNGRDIPKSRADLILKERAAQGMPDNPQTRQSVRDELISREVVVQEAEKKGVLQNPEVAQQLELARQQILLRAYLSEYLKQNPVPEGQVKAEYDRVAKAGGGNEYKASHILVKTEDEAKDIIGKIRKGAKFADLAKFSDDPGSKDNGGDLGWNGPSTFVKPFSDALVKLKKGEMTQEPVQTQYGYHVIRVDDIRPMKPPSMDQLRPRIQQQLQQQQIEKLVAELKAKSTIQ